MPPIPAADQTVRKATWEQRWFQIAIAEWQSPNRRSDVTPEPSDADLWVAHDHYTGGVIQRLTGRELEDFYAEHENWVEYSGLVDELRDQLKYAP